MDFLDETAFCNAVPSQKGAISLASPLIDTTAALTLLLPRKKSPTLRRMRENGRLGIPRHKVIFRLPRAPVSSSPHLSDGKSIRESYSDTLSFALRLRAANGSRPNNLSSSLLPKAVSRPNLMLLSSELILILERIGLKLDRREGKAQKTKKTCESVFLPLVFFSLGPKEAHRASWRRKRRLIR